MLSNANGQLLSLSQSISVDLYDAWEYNLLTELILRASESEHLLALDGEVVMVLDRVNVTLLVLRDLVKEVFVNALVEDE